MNYSIIPNTRMSNPDGIMKHLMYFGLADLIKSNTRLYFYKYDIYDLVEVEYNGTVITIYTYPNVATGAERVILDELEFYCNYFDTAGLKGKRFLFDINNKMPVSYDDFEEKEALKFNGKKDSLFVLDVKAEYITTKDSVHAFIGIENCSSVDNSLISLMNNVINFTKPKYKLIYDNTNTVSLVTILSGLLSGVDKSNLAEELRFTDLPSRFLYPVKFMEFNSEFVENKIKGLKFDKFTKLINSNKLEIVIGEMVEKEFSSDKVYLSHLIDMGLDKFIRSIKDPDKLVKVDIDEQQQAIKSMFISKGAAFINPGIIKTLNHFRELFDSDNVQFVMN